MAKVLPNGKQQYFDSNGDPLAGGKVYTYESGTTTPKATYADAGETALNTNPIILDARGEASVFWNGTYTVTVKDSLDNTIYSVDGLSTTTEITDIEFDGTSLDVILENNMLWAVTNITALKALDSTLHSIAYVKGYTTAGDGGGGVYRYDSGDTTSSDNGGSIIVGNDGARWKLQTFGQPWTVRQFGAVCDYVTDDTAAIQNSIDALGADGGVVVIDGWSLIGDLTINSNCTLKGINGIPAQSTTGNYGPASAPSGLVLPAANTITMGATGSSLEGLTIIEQELAPGQTYAMPLTSANASACVSGFSGEAVTLLTSSYGSKIYNCIFLGFEHVVNADNYIVSFYAENVFFDCINGITITSTDGVVSSFRSCRAEPFLTRHLADATKDQRNGVAFTCYNDGIYQYENCSSQNKSGFLADNAFVNHAECVVINDGTLSNTFFGFKYLAGGYNSVNSGCTAINCGGSNVYIDLPYVASTYYKNSISIIGANLENSSSASSANGLIYIKEGGYNITGCSLGYNGTYGYIKLGATSQPYHGSVDNVSVYGSQQPIFGDATAMLNCRVGYIAYRYTSSLTVQPLTWTPVIKIGATAQTGVTAYGHYTITNQHVTCYFDITMTSESGTGNVTITGLPYTAANETNTMLGMGCVPYYENMNGLAGAIGATVAKNTAIIDLWQRGATAATALTNTEVTSTSRLVGWVTYRIVQ